MEAGARTARLRALTISPATFEWLAWAALAMLWIIVLSGATVRLTGSGLGCENWPRCGDTLLPPKDYNAYVEFGNRVMGFAVGLTTLVTAAGAHLVRGLPRWLRLSALALPVSVLVQGVLGGITVLLELHPLIVMAHYLLSLVALALAVVVVQGARDLARGATADEGPLGSAWLALALVPLGLALVVSGALVTAAGPHSGGEEIPRVGDLVEMVHIHIGSTALFGIGFLALLGLLLVERRHARVELRLAGGVVALLLLQMAVGEIQWREGLPWGLVLAHVMIATTVWVLVFALATRIVVRRRARLQA
jgi:cytochrome c oxidase assembly protein subunit 15